MMKIIIFTGPIRAVPLDVLRKITHVEDLDLPRDTF